jgi:hypothetical protein
MILYYALGGGLGHLTRSLALIEHAPETLKSQVRILVSTKSAHAAQRSFPCPVDRVPDRVMADAGGYEKYLTDYFKMHSFRCVVMDTFPFGLLGEMKYKMPHAPRVLVGRYLRWEAYRAACGGVDDAAWPEDTVVIEQQDAVYDSELRNHGFVAMAPWPVSPIRPPDLPDPSAEPACCIVHSGPPAEIDQLVHLAKRVMAEKCIPGLPRVFTPENALFPMERHLSGFTNIVTGAGYASCAAALVLKGHVQYHLNPFKRKFDDQNLRFERLERGTWPGGGPGNVSHAARILWDLVLLHT